MTAKPLFLYVESMTMTPEILKRIERAGYIPLAVPSFDSVKVLDLLPVAQLDAISKAAFDTIRCAAGFHNAVREDFGQRVAKALGTKQP